jgi:hypothetical protein
MSAPSSHFIKFTESVAPALHFDATIDAQDRHRDIATETSTGGTAQRYAFGGESVLLHQAQDRALGAVALVA